LYYAQYFNAPDAAVTKLEFYFALSDFKYYGKLAALLLDDKLPDHDTFQTIVEKYLELTKTYSLE